jgi:hypothetical protein
MDDPSYRGGNEQWGRTFDYRESCATGRNIRTVWEITTQPYPEAHFATFPEELPRRCIKAGTSQKGCCPKCGAPWERIIEKKRPDDWEDEGPTTEKEKGIRAISEDIYGGNQKSRSISDIFGRATKSKIVEKGWQPTCDCGYFICREGHVSHNAIQRPSETKSVQGGLGKEEVLRRQSVQEQGEGSAQGDFCEVRELRRELQGEEERPVLFSQLCREVDVEERSRKSLPEGVASIEASVSEGLSAIQFQRIQDQWVGIQTDIESHSSNGRQEGICVGTQDDNVRFDRKTIIERGGRPSQEWQSLGQQIGESDAYDVGRTHTITGNPLPQVRTYVCSRCGETVEWLSFQPIPCTVLDPFAGSGTTGWVARSLGRKAILIELNPIYGDLIRKRAMTDVPDLLSFDEPELETEAKSESELGDGTLGK